MLIDKLMSLAPTTIMAADTVAQDPVPETHEKIAPK